MVSIIPFLHHHHSLTSIFVSILYIIVANIRDLRETRVSPNDTLIQTLARFAVHQHNNNQNAFLEFASVLKATEQVVAGTLYRFRIEAIDAHQKKVYEAKVWVKPWMNFKELQEFKLVDDRTPSITPLDLRARKGGRAPGWKEVPVNDPEVQNAGNHALKTIQSNSLLPHELQEIAHEKAEVAEDAAKFSLHLKVEKGNQDEKK